MRKIITAIMAMFFGGIIYVSCRSSSLLMFGWFDALGMRSQLLALQQLAKPYSVALPRWVIFSLPQALWLFSGMVAFSCIWGRRDVLNKRLWWTAFCTIAFGFELGQLIGFVPGHFDISDIALLFLAIPSAWFMDQFENHCERSMSI